MGTRWTIYCHTHTESGRRYIGLTKLTMMKRWNQHLHNAKSKLGKGCRYFWSAIRKYGKDAFLHEVLEVCSELGVANLAEESWIEFYDTRNSEKGFNLMQGGLHTPHSVKTDYWNRPGFREKASAVSKASWTPEYRQKMSKISKEVHSRPEIVALGSSFKGKHHSDESKRKISEVQRGKKLSNDHKEKIRQASSGRKLSTEARAKISAAMKGRRPSDAAIKNGGATLKRLSLERTHFNCKVHGPIPIGECHKKIGLKVRYECIVCRKARALVVFARKKLARRSRTS